MKLGPSEGPVWRTRGDSSRWPTGWGGVSTDEIGRRKMFRRAAAGKVLPPRGGFARRNGRLGLNFGHAITGRMAGTTRFPPPRGRKGSRSPPLQYPCENGPRGVRKYPNENRIRRLRPTPPIPRRPLYTPHARDRTRIRWNPPQRNLGWRRAPNQSARHGYRARISPACYRLRGDATHRSNKQTSRGGRTCASRHMDIREMSLGAGQPSHRPH